MEYLEAQEQMLAELSDRYFEVFGVRPSRAKEDKFLHDNPGAVDLWIRTHAS